MEKSEVGFRRMRYRLCALLDVGERDGAVAPPFAWIARFGG